MMLDKYARRHILTPPWEVKKRSKLSRFFYSHIIRLYMKLEIKRRRILGQPVGPGMFGECPKGPKGVEGPSSGSTHSTSDLD